MNIYPLLFSKCPSSIGTFANPADPERRLHQEDDWLMKIASQQQAPKTIIQSKLEVTMKGRVVQNHLSEEDKSFLLEAVTDKEESGRLSAAHWFVINTLKLKYGGVIIFKDIGIWIEELLAGGPDGDIGEGGMKLGMPPQVKARIPAITEPIVLPGEDIVIIERPLTMEDDIYLEKERYRLDQLRQEEREAWLRSCGPPPKSFFDYEEKKDRNKKISNTMLEIYSYGREAMTPQERKAKSRRLKLPVTRKKKTDRQVINSKKKWNKKYYAKKKQKVGKAQSGSSTCLATQLDPTAAEEHLSDK